MDQPLAAVAAKIGRSYKSVSWMRTKMRQGKAPTRQAWSDEENEIIHTWAGHATDEAIAAKLIGRTPRAVEHQRRVVLGVRVGNGDRHINPHKIGGRPLVAKTCIGCGKLMSGDSFGWVHTTRSWQTYCKWCRSSDSSEYHQRNYHPLSNAARRTSKYQESLQDLTLQSAGRGWNPYLDADERILADPDLTVLEKALALGRTYHATMSALSRRDIKSHRSLGDQERDRWHIDNPNAGNIGEIAASLAPVTPDEANRPELVSAGRPDFDWDD